MAYDFPLHSPSGLLHQLLLVFQEFQRLPKCIKTRKQKL